MSRYSDLLIFIAKEERIEVTGLIEAIGNTTAAMNSDLQETLQTLSAGLAIEVLKPDGGLRRPGAAVKISDVLLKPLQPRFHIFG